MIRLVVVCLMLTTAAHADEYYLDSSASGLNDGSSWVNAYESWSDVDLYALDGGGTVYISGGSVSKTYNIYTAIDIHHTIDGVDGSPIVFKVSQEEGHNGIVVIDGGDVSTYIFDITNNEYITIDGEVSGQRHMRLVNWGVPVPDGLRHPAIKASGGSVGPTGSTVRYVEIINDDTSCQTETCEGGVDIDYKSCIVFTSGYDWGITIEHNYLEGCIREGIGVGSATAEGYPMGTNIIRYNVVKGFRNHNGLGGPDGMKGLGSTDVYNNTVYHEELLNAEYNPSHIAEDGIQMISSNTRVYNNIVHGISQGAIRHDELGTVSNVFVYNNLIYQSHYSSGFELQRGLQLDCENYSNVWIYNNTIVGYTYIGFDLKTRGSTASHDIHVYNNILYDSPFITDATDNFSGEDISHNIIINSDGSKGEQSVAIVQSYDPYDPEKSVDFISYTPNTVDNDFRLTAGSDMAINTGVTTALLTDDIDGISRPQGAAYDIGAYEYILGNTGQTQQGTGAFTTGTGSLTTQ